MQTQRGTCYALIGVIFDGVVFDGVVWVGFAMIWAWLVGVASLLELVFKKLCLRAYWWF